VSFACQRFPALGTTALIVVVEPAALDRAVTILRDVLFAVDRSLSRFRFDSELSAINRAAGSEVAVSPLCLEAVLVALDVAASTGGLVDPTVGANLRLAGYDRTFAELQLRDGRRVHARFPGVAGWQTVRVDRRRRTIRVPAGVELDLGATAKALAADRASTAAANANGCGVLVSLGGDVAVAGERPEGSWPIGIADDQAAPLRRADSVVGISVGGLATSGTRVRRWTTSGGELHHIVDPRNGRPAVTPWKTVSVAAESCVLANAASTAAIVMGSEAPAWLERRGVPARMVGENGTVTTLNGWPADSP
jgi:thiamine biosynthesis lipoprotein